VSINLKSLQPVELRVGVWILFIVTIKFPGERWLDLVVFGVNCPLSTSLKRSG
jgi:hypothetical protein